MMIEHLFRVRFISYINIHSAVAPVLQETQKKNVPIENKIKKMK